MRIYHDDPNLKTLLTRAQWHDLASAQDTTVLIEQSNQPPSVRNKLHTVTRFVAGSLLNEWRAEETARQPDHDALRDSANLYAAMAALVASEVRPLEALEYLPLGFLSIIDSGNAALAAVDLA